MMKLNKTGHHQEIVGEDRQLRILELVHQGQHRGRAVSAHHEHWRVNLKQVGVLGQHSLALAPNSANRNLFEYVVPNRAEL